MSRRGAARANGPRQLTGTGNSLSERQRRFVEYYAASGNGTRAALLAGYATAGARVQAVRLPTKANILAAIRTRVQRREKEAAAGTYERDRILTQIIRDERIPVGERIRAIVEFNKSTGRHSNALHRHVERPVENAV